MLPVLYGEKHSTSSYSNIMKGIFSRAYNSVIPVCDVAFIYCHYIWFLLCNYTLMHVVFFDLAGHGGPSEAGDCSHPPSLTRSHPPSMAHRLVSKLNLITRHLYGILYFFMKMRTYHVKQYCSNECSTNHIKLAYLFYVVKRALYF